MEFWYGTDMKKALFDVQSLMNVVQADLPMTGANLKPSWVLAIDPLNLPVLSLAVTGEGYDPVQLRMIVENEVVNRLKVVKDVYSVVPFGGQKHAMARSRADQALFALKATLGLDLASAVTLADRLELSPLRVSVEESLRQASERHPEILAAVRQRQAAEAEARAARGAYFPQVSLSYMYDWAWMKQRGMPAEKPEGYSVGVVVTLPLFDGFMRENAVKTARARLERALQAEALARQQIARDLNQAALMLAATEKSVQASRKGLEQAEEDYRVVRERFESGRGIQLEILDA